jgi:hypothetical protein
MGDKCEECDGSGACQACKGSGKCADCGGTGHIEDNCPHCQNYGRIPCGQCADGFRPTPGVCGECDGDSKCPFCDGSVEDESDE